MFCKKIVKDTVPKQEFRIILPFLGPLSEKIQRRTKKLFDDYIPAAKINIVFTSQRKLRNLFRFKDVIPSQYDSHVIYRFKCPSCNAGYVGETRVHHIVRNSQHLGISEFSGNISNSGVPTNVTKHIMTNNCNCGYDNFSIIGKEEDYHRRLIKESLFIKFYDDNLNAQQTSTKLELF